MPEWLLFAVIMVTIFFVIPAIWTWLQEKGGKAGKVADAAEAVGDTAQGCFSKLIALGLILLGLVSIIFNFMNDFQIGLLLGGIVLIGIGLFMWD